VDVTIEQASSNVTKDLIDKVIATEYCPILVRYIARNGAVDHTPGILGVAPEYLVVALLKSGCGDSGFVPGQSANSHKVHGDPSQ
jgi:hypothetical protein